MAEQWLHLLRASYHFQLVSLFEICERALTSLVNGNTARRFHDIAQTFGANRLMQKCLQLRSNVSNNSSPVEVQLKIDRVNTDFRYAEMANCSVSIQKQVPLRHERN